VVRFLRSARLYRALRRADATLAHRDRDKRGLPGVTRDWNAPVKPGAPLMRRNERGMRADAAVCAGAPTPKDMLLEFQAWRTDVEKERCLKAGLPLPPALTGAPAVALLEAAQAVEEAPGAAPPVQPAPRKKAAKPITWAHAVTKQQLLALLDRQSQATAWAALCQDEDAACA
jgi:hypothetical protein